MIGFALVLLGFVILFSIPVRWVTMALAIIVCLPFLLYWVLSPRARVEGPR